MLKNPSDFPWGTVLIMAGVGAVIYFWYEGAVSGKSNPISAIGSGVSNAVNSVNNDLKFGLGAAGLGGGAYLAAKGYSAFAGSGSSTAASEITPAVSGDTYNFFGSLSNDLEGGLSNLESGLESGLSNVSNVAGDL